MIDAHVHLYPPAVAADPAGWAASRGEGHWAKLCTRVRKDGRPVQGFPKVADLLAELDRAKIEQAWLQGWYWEHFSTCREQNQFYAECIEAHPGRLAAFATLHLEGGRAAVRAELEWARAAGFIGIGELSPHSQGYSVSAPLFSEVLELAGEFGLLVNLHVSDPDGQRYPGWVETPVADLLWAAETFPRTRFILAHLGGRLALKEPRLLRQPNVYFDTAALPLLYPVPTWPALLADHGHDRVLFGSDYPLHLYPNDRFDGSLARFVTDIGAAGATPAVFGDTAARLAAR